MSLSAQTSHSRGAFMAANLLAQSDLFKARIARNGAHDATRARSTTPSREPSSNGCFGAGHMLVDIGVLGFGIALANDGNSGVFHGIPLRFNLGDFV